MWTYEEAMQYLNQSLVFGRKKGLYPMRQLLNYFGNPDHNLRFIHLAGTNGKGSTAMALAVMCAAAGLKTGLYTSPYVERFSERIRCLCKENYMAAQVQRGDGEIDKESLARLLAKVKTGVEAITPAISAYYGEKWQPSYFEILTVSAILYYAELHCDVVVWETGLGGEFDSTNVIERAEITILTALNYDHCEYLGNTLAEIAAAKAGIIKPGTMVFLYDILTACPDPVAAGEALRVVMDKCQACKVPLYVIKPGDFAVCERGLDGIEIDLRQAPTCLYKPAGCSSLPTGCSSLPTGSPSMPTGCSSLPTVVMRKYFIPLIGQHQAMNMAVAIFAGATFLRQQTNFTDAQTVSTIVAALPELYWPARLEVLQKNPPVLLDGAHNVQGATALGAALHDLGIGHAAIWVCGFVRGKNHVEMVRHLIDTVGRAPLAIICLTPPEPKRAVPAMELRQDLTKLNLFASAGGDTAFFVAADPAEALSIWQRDYATAPLVAFGSLYLAGPFKQAWRKFQETRNNE